MPRWVRWILTALIIILALFFWAITLTVPLISATAPALIAIALSITVYFIWPKNREMVVSERKSTEIEDQEAQVKKMKDAGWSNVSIASRTGIPENTVREMLK